jgi:hypothetical protein
MVRRLVYALSQLVRRIEDRLQRFFRHPVVRKLTIDGCLVARVGSERHHESEMQIGEERHEDPAPFASRLVPSLGIGEELNAEIVRHRLYPMQPAESGEQDIELAGISQRVCRGFATCFSIVYTSEVRLESFPEFGARKRKVRFASMN